MKKLLIVGVVAILGALSLGAAASITVDGGGVGSGTGTVGGFVTSNTTWVTDGNGDVTGVSFDITNAPTSVDVQTDGVTTAGPVDGFGNWDCVAGVTLDFDCTTNTSPVASGGINNLTVVASS